MKRITKEEKKTKYMNKILYINLKIDFFLKTNLKIKRLSIRGKNDMKEAFRVHKDLLAI